MLISFLWYIYSFFFFLLKKTKISSHFQGDSGDRCMCFNDLNACFMLLYLSTVFFSKIIKNYFVNLDAFSGALPQETTNSRSLNNILISSKLWECGTAGQHCSSSPGLQVAFPRCMSTWSLVYLFLGDMSCLGFGSNLRSSFHLNHLIFLNNLGWGFGLMKSEDTV